MEHGRSMTRLDLSAISYKLAERQLASAMPHAMRCQRPLCQPEPGTAPHCCDKTSAELLASNFSPHARGANLSDGARAAAIEGRWKSASMQSPQTQLTKQKVIKISTRNETQLNETQGHPVRMAGVRDNLLNTQAVTRWHVRERLSSPPKVHSNPARSHLSHFKYGRVAPLRVGGRAHPGISLLSTNYQKAHTRMAASNGRSIKQPHGANQTSRPRGHRK